MLGLTAAAIVCFSLPPLTPCDLPDTPCHAVSACAHGQALFAIALPVDRPARLAKPTAESLEEAARNGDLPGVQAALKAGVNPSGKRGQLSPLHWAVAQRLATDGRTLEPSIEIVRALLDAGANVNVKDYLGQTPLEWAATYASPQIVKLLLEAGAEVNAESSYGTALLAADRLEIAKLLLDAGADVDAGKVISPLANAAKTGDVELVRLLIKYGAKADDTKHTPILWAGKPEVYRALTAAGAKPDQRSAAGDTLLHLPFPYYLPQTETLRLVLEAGLDINTANGVGQTPLHRAAQQGLSEVVELYIKAGASLDAKDQQGNTPLSLSHESLAWARGYPTVDDKPFEMVIGLLVAAGAKDDGRTELQQAVAANDLAKVRLMIAAKTNVNATGLQKTTAVHVASELGHHEALKLLLDAGAKPDMPDAQSIRPLHLASNAKTAQALIDAGASVQAVPDTPAYIPTPLFMAAVKGRADVVTTVLKHASVEDEAKFGVLNWAVLAGHLEVVKVLLQGEDAQAFLNPQQFFLPLHVATSGSMGFDVNMQAPSPERRLAIAKLLIEKGARVDGRWGVNMEMDPDSPVVGLVGSTPLMFAAQQGEVEMVALLLEQGADIKATNSDRQTALHFAAEQGHLAVVQLLISKNADPNARTKAGQTPLDLTSSAEVKDDLLQNGGKTSAELE